MKIRPKQARKRNNEQIVRDIAFITPLYIKGYSVRNISLELNNYLDHIGEDYTLSPTQVHFDIKAIQEQWRKDSFETLDQHIRKALAKLDQMEVELWEAWDRSKGKRVKIRFKGGVFIENANGKHVKQSDTETLNGDPRYMDLLLRVEKERSKLLGYDKPDQVVLVDKTEDKRERLLKAFEETNPELLKELSNSMLGIEVKNN